MKKITKFAGMMILVAAVATGCGNSETKIEETKAVETTIAANKETGTTAKPLADSKSNQEASAPDGYPKKVVQLIVVRAAGGGTDNVARALANGLEAKIGQPVVVMNVEGGDGLIGMNEALNADPDGYTFVVTGSTEIPNLLVNGQGAKFTQDDVKPVCQLASKGNVLILKKGSRFTSMDELIAYAKENPGKLTVGVAGGNSAYLAIQIAKELGIEVTVVNGNNGNELYAQLLGGHIECAVLGTQFYQNAVDEGLLTLASTEDRMEDLEGQPKTFKQLGYDFSIETFTYLAAPADTPVEICQYLSDCVGELMADGLQQTIDDIGQGGNYKPMVEVEPYVKEYNNDMIDIYTEIKASK